MFIVVYFLTEKNPVLNQLKVSFSIAHAEKNLSIKLGETKIGCWWFDITNKIKTLKKG